LQNELLEELLVSVVGLSLRLGFVLEGSGLADVLRLCHEVGDLSGVDEVIDADEECLLDDLSVGDDECLRFGGLDCSLFIEHANVFLETDVVVVALNQNLVPCSFVQIGGKFCQRLFA